MVRNFTIWIVWVIAILKNRQWLGYKRILSIEIINIVEIRKLNKKLFTMV